MNNVEEVIQAISIGLIVASFLLNTNRFLKTIELCKECLFILKDQKLSKSLYIRIYLIMLKACNRINDNTNAMKYAEKLLQIYRESGERLQEYKLSVKLGKMYFHQSRYTRAIQVTEKALLIVKKLETEMEKLPVTETLEPFINQLANMRRLENISRTHLGSTKKLET